MLKRIPAALAIGVGMLCLLCLPAASHAQAVHGAIIGNVVDNTGAAIPGATVTVTDEGKGTQVVVQSNAAGEYEVHELIPDLYDVKVTYQGFETFETKGIQVNADTTAKVDVSMIVGGASTTVEVNADTVPVLKTDRADVSTVFTTQDVASLPINGRNFTQMQLLLPGAQELGWSHASDENPQGSSQIQVDGQAFGGVSYELDGTDNQDAILGIIVINPALDSISESKITTQNFDAEFGKAVSSVVTVQTKSGTNSFHGSAFDYRESNAQLAKDPYTQFPAFGTTPRSPVPAGRRNQFGGSIGGPILKDKLFFFADYQGLRQVAGVSATSTIPTALLTNTCLGTATTTTGVPGCDFSQYVGSNGAGSGIIYQQPTKGNGLLAPTPYPGNVIPAAQIAPEWLNVLKLMQPYSAASVQPVAGTLTGVNNNYTASGSGPFNNNQWDERVDYTLNEKTHIFERFSRFTATLDGEQMFGALGGPGLGYNNYGGNSKAANDSLAMGVDYALSANLLTDFRFGYYRYNIGDDKNDQNVAGAANLGILGLNINDPITGGLPDFNVTSPGNNGNNNFGDGLAVSRCNCPLIEREDQFQIVNNWTKIVKTHSIKFGADLRYARNLRVPSDSNRTGILNLTNGPTSNPFLAASGGNGWASFALGQVANMQRYVSVSTNAKEFQKRDFFYVQDTWRVTPNLTANLGLRYEFYFPESVNAKGNGALMELDNGAISNGYINVAGYGQHPSNMGWTQSKYAFNPRIGLAYQFDAKTVIRAGYGRSFDIGVFGSMYGHVVTQNIPVLANQSVNAPSGNGTTYAFCLGANEPNCTPAAGQPNGGPIPYAFPAVPASGLLPNPGALINTKARPDRLRMPTIDAWNLSIQHAITPTLSVTFAYVANKGTHTLSAGDGNSTNPAENGLVLPAQFSITGQPLHWDPNPTNPGLYGIGADGGTNTANFLSRFYGGTNAACQDPNYVQPVENGITPGSGQCGWTSGISYYGNDQNSEYQALQISMAKQYTKGLSLNANYAWQAGYDFNGGYSTWSKAAVRGPNNDIRRQQFTLYGVYDLPFGRKGMFDTNAPTWVDEIIGGWQINPVLNWASGLPFTLDYNECNASVGGTSAPCYPNGRAGFLKTSLSGLNPLSHQRTYYQSVVPAGHNLCDGGFYSGFTCAGLDTIGNVGRNSAWGPKFFNTDLSLIKNFQIHESVVFQFRMDAYNAFNIVSAGNPCGGGGATCSIESTGIINSGSGSNAWPGYGPGAQPRQLQFSFRINF
jgi:Carboxypeptidase regulatory-like domain/TonB dependent receptor